MPKQGSLVLIFILHRLHLVARLRVIRRGFLPLSNEGVLPLGLFIKLFPHMVQGWIFHKYNMLGK